MLANFFLLVIINSQLLGKQIFSYEPFSEIFMKSYFYFPS